MQRLCHSLQHVAKLALGVATPAVAWTQLPSQAPSFLPIAVHAR